MFRPCNSLPWSLPLWLLVPVYHAEATRVSVDAMEVTQSLQALDAQPIPLIAGKQTAVRFYLYCHGSELTVRGWLEVENDVGDLLYLGSERPNRACTRCENERCPGGELPLADRRSDALLSLNFFIDPDWVREGSLHLRLQQLEEAATGEILEWSGQGERIISIEQDVPLRLALLSIDLGSGNSPPQEAELQQAESWLRQAYPVGQIIASKRTLTSSDPSLRDSCVTINTLVLAARNVDLATGTDPRTHYYGMFASFRGPDRGCALGIPDLLGRDPDPLPPVASGLNTSTPGKYAGHEIAHTLGAHHSCKPRDKNNCCEPDIKKQVPLLSAAGDFVGWSFGDASSGRSPEALVGNEWSDIMSYHPKRWVGSETSRRLRDKLLQEDGLLAVDLSKIQQPAGLFVGQPINYLNLVGSTKAKFFYMTALSLLPIKPVTSRGLSVYVRDARAKTWRKAEGAWGKAYRSRCDAGLTYFDILVPMDSQTTGIELQWNLETLATLNVVLKPLWIKDVCLAPEDPRKPGSRLALVWRGDERRKVQYSVQQSIDGGAWETIAVGLLTRSLPLRNDIAEGESTRFRVAVTDGINSAVEEAPGIRCGAGPR